MIEIYTDGACIPNPGSGGWGFVAFERNKEVFRKWGGLDKTTNNVMEMTAIVRALEFVGSKEATIYSDSQYCINGINLWRHSWKRTSWKKGALKNIGLWKELDELANASKAKFVWVKGHNGHARNELADELAERGRMYAQTLTT
jgi:ribonuclease HI